MIKLFALKQQKSQQSQSSTDSTSQQSLDSQGKKAAACQIRLQTDMSQLDLPLSCKLEIPDHNDLLNFFLYITPDEGVYKGGRFKLSFKFKTSYPHDPPKVTCTQKIYHPNIDLEGNVCLNILREDWTPVLNLQAIIMGLNFLFLEPNADDPLNKDAAQVMRKDPVKFERNVRYSMAGSTVDGVQFDRILV
ncbi:hypothetical protein MIR68_008654 [Amoeboaphelidium protococcarum]|nr:hypothetical protein MIR68_008654 [Amoeboaphelidium protococcarum]KAI3644161.1 hypothetical protein MP228_010325 [Amoeboaphelidium protococcarum]